MATSVSHVFRRRDVRLRPTPIPESMYKAETFVQRAVQPPIKASAGSEALSQVKKRVAEEPPLPDIPKHQSPAPDFAPVELRANRACLHRDVGLMRRLSEEASAAKAAEPTEFLTWQARMRAESEAARVSVIDQRHSELDGVRKRAIREKKRLIAERFELGRSQRVDFGREVAAVEREIEVDRARIRELKAGLVDRGWVATFPHPARDAFDELCESFGVAPAVPKKPEPAPEAEAEEVAAPGPESDFDQVAAHERLTRRKLALFRVIEERDDPVAAQDE